jgi:hypothetical protein
MPNRPQLVFLATFFISFISLLALSKFISSKLRETGYDLSRLILIGISQSHQPTPNQMTSSFLDVNQSLVAQLSALFLAVATSAFIYLKFGRSGTSSFSFLFTLTSHALVVIKLRSPFSIQKTGKSFLSRKRLLSPQILPCL